MKGWRHSGINVDEDKIRKDEDGLDDIDDFWKACSTNSGSGTPRRTFKFDNPDENDGLSNLSPMISSDSDEVAPARRRMAEPVIEELPPTPVHSQSESLEDRMRQVTRRSPIFSGRKRDRSVFADEDVPKPNFDSPRQGTGGKKPILAQIEDAHFDFGSDSGEMEESPAVVKASPVKKQKKKTDEEKLSQMSERRKQARARKETEFERPKPPLQLMEAIETKQPAPEVRPSQRRSLIQVRNSDSSRSSGTPRPTSKEGRMPQPMQFSLSHEDKQAREEESDEDSPLLKIVPATKKSTPEKRKGTPRRSKDADELKRRVDTPRPGRKPKGDAQEGGHKRRDGVKDTPRPVRKTKEATSESQLASVDTEATKRARKSKGTTPSKKEAKTASQTRKPKFNWFSSGDELSTDDIVSIPPEPEGDPDDDLPIALRRTRRVKVKPLRFWRGEKIVYKLADDDGLPCFGSVHRVLKRDEKK